MSAFTPEQEAEIKKQVEAAKAQIHAEYDAKAHKFRDWINTHDALWASRRFGMVGVIVGVPLGAWAHSLYAVLVK